ncbi:adenylate/guanylate cyclase domain-containing protein [Caenispirillum bisanense]|uniref:Adenylate cyclase n=1 Tax=Caenispirillum bisanense TaxID=414052 RepID=A0A286GXQ2_9PROT|nr:adenylate/guanylate cyclase domain-containing protein [Caenispirillum bisanense]SOD99956.1 adenylate cyclase [Caenispirillum bisanense]
MATDQPPHGGRTGGLTFRVNIATVFTALVLCICGTIIAYTYDRHSDAVLDQAGTVIESAADAAIRHTGGMLQPLGSAVSALAALGAADPELARDPAVFPVLLRVLREHPQLQSVYFAFEDGRFLQAFAVPPDVRRYGPNDTPTHPEVAYAVRVLDRGGAAPVDRWSYLTADGTELLAEDAREVTYDARNRDWYKAVKARAEAGDDGVMWTDVVIFTSSRLPGVAPAVPMVDDEGRFLGAAAANITLESLSGFLQTLVPQSSGAAFVLDGDQRLIAFPDASRTVRQLGTTVELVPADQLEEVWLAEAVRHHQGETGRGRYEFTLGGSHYMAAFLPFPEGVGGEWTMAVVVPTDDFVGSLKDTTREIIILSVAVTLIGMVLIGLFSQWISRPLRQMVAEFDRIIRFDMDNGRVLRSNVQEINQLAGALVTLRTALQIFGRYVPKELVRDLIASGQPIALGGQSRHVTILFSDIAGFTQLSERMPTRELMLLVSDHLAAVAQAVLETEGTIDKYIGDSVMAFWGAPVPDDDHAANACLAALLAQARLAEVNRRAAEEGRPVLQTRIGLHADSVMVGNIGSMERMSYTVMGDGANVAARLEGANKVYGTGILASHAVFRDAGERFLFRPLDLVAVKGRREPVRIYELMGAHDPRRPDVAATAEQRALAALTEAGFYAYMERQWDAAEAAYREIEARFPTDPLPAMFLTRIALWRTTPPPEGWTGVHELTTK